MNKPYVLIVDDEVRFLESLSLFLKKDFNVITAHNGKDGLRLFQSNPHISIILLDLEMPLMDGAEMLLKIRENGGDVNVIIMTGRSSHEYARKCADLNVQGYIEKPFGPDELMERLKKLTGNNCYNLYTALWGNDYEKTLDAFSPVVMKAIKMVDSNYAASISREDIASSLKVSADYLGKVFKKESGIHLGTYINERRIHESKIILTGSDRVKISDVAKSVGLNDAYYFSRLFKRYTGLPPKEYVKKNTFS